MKMGGLILLENKEESLSETPSGGEEFAASVRDTLPVLFAMAPFAALFGALSAEQGFSLFETLLTSGTIIAGASQFGMLELLGQQVPWWTIVLTVFAINFRHVLYSASIGRKFGRFSTLQKGVAFFVLTDPTYAAAEARARAQVLTPRYFFYYSSIIYSVWMGFNLLGAVFGNLIKNPAAYGIDFILPVYFVGLVMAFKGAKNFVPILVAAVIVSLIAWSIIGAPWHISIGGLVGMTLAAALSKPKNEPEKSDV